MNKRVFVLAFMLGLGSFLTQGGVFVTSYGTVVDSLGVPVPDGNQVRIGYFDLNDGFDILAAAHSGDWEGTVAHWHGFEITTIDSTAGIPPHSGFFSASVDNTVSDLPDLANFVGQPIYVWAFKTTANQAPNSWSDIKEWGIFLNPSLSSWTFPPNVDATSPAYGTFIDSSDVGVIAHQNHGGVIEYQTTIVNPFTGNPEPQTFVSLQLSHIPEPGTWAVMTGMGLLLFTMIRRRLGKC